MYGNATRRANAAAAGLPANLFYVNPILDVLNVIRNGGYTNYNSVVIDLRRRLSKGVQVNANYTFAKTQVSNFVSLRRPRNNGISTSTAPSIPHVFKGNWTYELPIGQGKRFLGGAGGFLNRVVGGWEFYGTGRLQTGDPIDVGNVRMIGLTRKELQKLVKIRFDDAARIVYVLPQDIIDNTIRANNVSATSSTGFGTQGAPSGRYFAPANGPNCIEFYSGDCGATSVVVWGPKYISFDLSLAKKTRITESMNFEIRAEMYNAFNNTNFSPPGGFGPGNTPRSDLRFGQVTSVDGGARTIQLVGRINF